MKLQQIWNQNFQASTLSFAKLRPLMSMEHITHSCMSICSRCFWSYKYLVDSASGTSSYFPSFNSKYYFSIDSISAVIAKSFLLSRLCSNYTFNRHVKWYPWPQLNAQNLWLNNFSPQQQQFFSFWI